LLYAEPSKPAGTAPAAGLVCVCADSAVAVRVMVMRKVKAAFMLKIPFYDLIMRPSASFMYELIMEGAPFLAAPPVQEITSPGFTVLRVHP